MDQKEQPTERFYRVHWSDDEPAEPSMKHPRHNYILSGSQLDLMQSEMEEFAKDGIEHDWIYAFADADGGGSSGTAVLHLRGHKIDEIQELKGYSPPSDYCLKVNIAASTRKR